ncbi:MAG: hypothetical protein Solivirus1_66 [Solivirus sp.]|uniref:Uncharacterized protein n=1 Tax=Solivirus sp. TaxID=2487772 RepID=A0A3G5AJR9_9VIRU|nr:MAG: hypothetical protein Solivirus1_66 [Solivirus sp.]
MSRATSSQSLNSANFGSLGSSSADSFNANVKSAVPFSLSSGTEPGIQRAPSQGSSITPIKLSRDRTSGSNSSETSFQQIPQKTPLQTPAPEIINLSSSKGSLTPILAGLTGTQKGTMTPVYGKTPTASQFRGNQTPGQFQQTQFKSESPSLTSIAVNRTPTYPVFNGESQAPVQSFQKTPTQGLQQFQQSTQIPQQGQKLKLNMTPLIPSANLKYPDPSVSKPDATPYGAPVYNTGIAGLASPSSFGKPYKTPIQLNSIQQLDGRNFVPEMSKPQDSPQFIDTNTQLLLASESPSYAEKQRPQFATAATEVITKPLSFKTNEEALQERPQLVVQPVVQEATELTETLLLQKLEEKGFHVFSTLVEGGKFKHFVAKDTRGDIVVIIADQEIEKQTDYSSSDLLVSKMNIPLVPTRLKQGSLTCASEGESCKTAFICNDALCILSLTDQKRGFMNEEALVFQNSDNKLFGSKKGNGSVAFPAISLSTILNINNTKDNLESLIQHYSENLVEFAERDLMKEWEDFVANIENFYLEVTTIKMIMDKFTEFNLDVEGLERNYEELLPIETDESRGLIGTVSKNLAEKKVLRVKMLNALYNSFAYSNIIKTFTNDVTKSINSVLNDYMRAIGKIEME